MIRAEHAKDLGCAFLTCDGGGCMQAKFKDLWTNPKGGANIIVFLR